MRLKRTGLRYLIYNSLLLTLLSPLFSFADSTFTIGIVNLPMENDPAKIADTSTAFVLNQIYENLYDYNEKNNLVPVLAESHLILPDNCTFIISLRNDIYFEDGSKITAQDVVASIARSIRTLGKESAWAFENLLGFNEFINNKNQKRPKGLEVLSELKVSFKLNQPFGQFLQVLSAPYFSITKFKENKVLGSGAWKVSKADTTEWVLEKIDKLKNTTAPDRLIFKKISDLRSAQEMIENGLLDLTEAYQLHKKSDLVRDIEYDYLQTIVLFFNTKKANLKNAKNRCQYSKTFKKYASEAGYKLDPLFKGLPYAWDLVHTGSPDSSSPEHSKVQQNLIPLSIQYTSVGGVVSLSKSVAEKISLYSKSSAAPIRMTDILPEQLFQNFTKGEFEAGIMSYVPDYLDADAFLAPFIRSNQQFNWMKYSDRKVDNLIAKYRATSNLTTRVALLRQVFEIIRQDCPVLFLGSLRGHILINKSWTIPTVSGLGFHRIRLRQVKRAQNG